MCVDVRKQEEKKEKKKKKKKKKKKEREKNSTGMLMVYIKILKSDVDNNIISQPTCTFEVDCIF